mgnify:CR=1 FL=1
MPVSNPAPRKRASNANSESSEISATPSLQANCEGYHAKPVNDNGEVVDAEVGDDDVTWDARAHLPPWQVRFLESIDRCPVVCDACIAARISRKTAYLWRQKDEAFRDAWDEAMENSIDRAEKAAFSRAIDGVETPIIVKGEEVGVSVEYSDRLLEFILKGHRPERYREKQQVDVTHGIAPELAGILADVRAKRVSTLPAEVKVIDLPQD